MSSNLQAAMRQSKRAAAHISKFHYHLEHTVPEFFPEEIHKTKAHSSPILRTKKGLRNMTFHFVEHSSEGVSTIDAESILLSALKIYVNAQCVKLTENSYKNVKTLKASYLPVYGYFQEIIEFFIVDKNQDYQQLNVSRWVKKSTSSKIKLGKESQSDSSMIRSTLKKTVSNNFQLYVIHHCHLQGAGDDHLKWENFIEKYHFKEDAEGGELRPKIHYQLIFNYQENQGFMSYFSCKDKLYQTFIEEHLSQKQGELKNIGLFQGYLLQSKDRIQRKLKQLNDPAFDESQKRWLKLSPEYFKMFTMLRKHAITVHREVHNDKEHLSDLTLSSLTYRYMIAKDFNYKECYEHITEYMKWEKELAQTYDLLHFQQYHNLDFYTYLGNDYQGRCVVLNKAAHLNVEKIDSVEDYCKYFSYYLEVYIPRRLKGYAQQYTVLADLDGLCSDNFKLSITKQNIHDGLKYCPERQFKLLAFNVGKFALFAWALFKHLLPAKTLHKISIMGEDRTQIMACLLQQMDAEVIPEYLGGSNKRTYKDDLADQKIYLEEKKAKKSKI